MKRPGRIVSFLVPTALVAAGFLCLLASGNASASNPTTISFQGKVVNADGTNVSDGTYGFVFKLYTTGSGGSALWTESDTLTVTNGIFQVDLGANCSFFTAASCNNNAPINFSASSSLYLGITFNSDPAGEMTPRVQLQSVPYAYYADNAGNSDELGGIVSSGYAQLSPSSQQSGSINVSGNITSGATVEGSTLTATGALQGNNLSVNGGNFAVNSSGVITAAAGLTSTGTATIQNATYTNSELLVDDGETGAPPVFPDGYAPALTVITSEVSGSRPLFFAYNNGGAYDGVLDSGACGAFTQMCLDLGSGSTVYTALENVGTTLRVGGGDDGNFSALALMPNGGSTTTGGNLSVTGTASATTSVLTPALTASGALAINSGGASNVTIDSGASGGAVTIGAANATSVGLSRSGETTTVNGALTVDQSATFDQGVVMSFNGSENLAITSDLAGSVNGISFIGTPSGTAGTTNALFVQQANSANTNGLDNGLTIDNADTNTPIGAAINITNSGGGGYTDYIDSPNFIVGGNGQIDGAGFDYFDPSTLTGTSTTLGSGGTTGSNFGGVFSSGAFIDDTDTYDQEFVGAIAAATTNNANAGDDGLWYFNNNNQAVMSGSDVSTTGGYYRIATGTTTGRGGLITEGATPGTLDAPLAAANLPIVQMKVRDGDARATDDMVFGMMDTATAPTANDTLPANGIVFWSDNSTGTTGWQGVIRKGSATEATVTCPTTADVTTGDFAVGRIVVVNSTTVNFFMDSNVASGGVNLIDCGTATVTAANMPTANMAMGMYVVQTTTTTENFDMDYARFWQDDAAPGDSDQADADSQAEQTEADLSTDTDTDSGAVSLDSVSAAAASSDQDATGQTGDDSDSPPSAADSASTSDSDLQPLPADDGATDLTDPSGTVQFTVDASGTTTLDGDLDLASADLSGGLTVGGDVNVAGLSTFQQLAAFLGKVIFHQDVEFDGHVTVSNDSAGYAVLQPGESTVHVTFQNPYDNPPIVNLSDTGGQFTPAAVNNVTTAGFDIVLQNPAAATLTYSWLALGVVNPLTASNPPPGATTTAN